MDVKYILLKEKRKKKQRVRARKKYVNMSELQNMQIQRRCISMYSGYFDLIFVVFIKLFFLFLFSALKRNVIIICFAHLAQPISV